MKETGGWPHRENYKRVVLNALQNIPAFESHYILSQYDELSVTGGVQAGRGGGAVVNNTAPSPPKLHPCCCPHQLYQKETSNSWGECSTDDCAVIQASGKQAMDHIKVMTRSQTDGN